MDREIKKYSKKIELLKKEIHKGIVGQEKAVESAIKCLICNSHGLLESVPGLAKTLLVKVTGIATGLKFARVQFTPDLLPSDIIGTEVYRRELGTFEVVKGPIFTNLLLADEINRSPPKVQSALLQAMEEKEVTIGGKTFKLPTPFTTLATQNPLEQEGVFPLSIAQNDRFFLKIYLTYPERSEELEIIERNIEKLSLGELGIKNVISGQDILKIYELVKRVSIPDELREYMSDLIDATRNPSKYGLKELEEYIKYGVSPRGIIFLSLAARVTAFMKGRNYVKADDIKEMIPYVLPHRLVLTYRAEAEKITPMQLMERITEEIPLI